MKFLALMITLFISQTGFANPLNDINHWVDRGERVVQYAPNPILKLSLQKVDIDRQTQGILSVNLEYESDYIQSTYEALKEQYPGYQIRRSFLHVLEKYEFSIPSLGIRRHAIDPYPGQIGPYVTTMFEVSKKDLPALERAMKHDPQSVVKIKGRYLASVKVQKVVESKSLPIQTCYKLAQGGDLYSAMQEYTIAVEEARRMRYSHSNTLKDLERSILVSCLDIHIPKKLNSFEELLNQRVQIKANAQAQQGQTVRRTVDKLKLRVKFVTTAEVYEEP